MSNLVDNINKINKEQQNQPKELEKLRKRIAHNHEKSRIKREFQRKWDAICDSFVKKFQQRRNKESYEQACYRSYDEFLNMASKTSGKNGIESYETDYGTGTIIFSKNYGPFVKTPIPNSENATDQSYLYEGFAQDEDGFYKYYNVGVEKIYDPSDLNPDNIIVARGFSIDPKSNRIEAVVQATHQEEFFLENYYRTLTKTTHALEK